MIKKNGNNNARPETKEKWPQKVANLSWVYTNFTEIMLA